MSILLLGRNGQLGWELQRTLAPLGIVHALDYPDINLAHPESARLCIRNLRPRILINATAYTAVDRAESEPQLAYAINAQAPGVLAEEAARLGAVFIHYSTDYVFDGAKGSDYLENDPPNPLNVYGQSKLAGEVAAASVGGSTLILRTSWVYSLRRESFVSKVLQWARQQVSLRVVSDQVGNPTWARMLAEVTAQLLAKASSSPGWLEQRAGLYHLAGSGRASRYDWARLILASDPHQGEQTTQEVFPASTADFPTPALRPLHSALCCDKFEQVFNLALPPWQDSLRMAMENLA